MRPSLNHSRPHVLAKLFLYSAIPLNGCPSSAKIASSIPLLSHRSARYASGFADPQPFGPLQGVRILSTVSLIAQPYGAALAAEMGAEVIQFERPGNGDLAWRTTGIQLEANDGGPMFATNWIQERRNVFCVTLDFANPRGRELFLKLAATADIWMESSKPGSYNRWGLDDESLWKVNPKLVITHISGYGPARRSRLHQAGFLRHRRPGLFRHDVPDWLSR